MQPDEEKIDVSANTHQDHLHTNAYTTEKDNGALQLFANTGNLKLAKDGKTVLIPQPSDDPNDPLNWSQGRKWALLLVLSFMAFGGDFQSGAGIPLLASQAEEWRLTPTKVNEAGNLNVLFLGIGGVLWIPFLSFWGRLPVMFWTQLIGTLLVMGSALVDSFEGYYALRPLTALFLTAGQTIGLLVISDMFFWHERARAIGVWVFVFLASPYLGPFVGGFLVYNLDNRWRPVLWLVFAYSCVVLLAMCIIGRETQYNRSLTQQPPKGSRIADLLGITGIRNRAYKPTIYHSVMRQLEIFSKPTILITFVVYAVSFMWAIGINVTSSILFGIPVEGGGYGFNVQTVSFIYFTPLVALAIGEAFGHYANDAATNHYIKHHDNIFRPEARLRTYYVASPLMIAGLVAVGQALQKQLSVGVVIIGWGLYVTGVMICSVSLTAYVLDSYPSAPGEVSAAVNLARILGGFSVGYFQLEWGLESGFDVTFGIQAATVAIVTLIVVGLSFFGDKIRRKGGPLHFSPQTKEH